MNSMAPYKQGLLDAALLYAERGWKVFPLHHVEEGRCSCTRLCTSPGKHPRSRNGFKDATTDPNTIRAWWKKWPHANIGIATGSTSGIVVLDIDIDHGGYESLTELLEWNDLLPETLTVNTGGGGKHFFFQCPNEKIRCSQGRLGKGIDVRGDRGYVVAAPSSHKSGSVYSVVDENVLPAEFPQWLLALLTPKQKESHTERDSYILIGSRNSLLTSYAGGLRRDGGEYHDILQALTSYNEQHCEVPLTVRELKQIATSVSEYPVKPILFRWRDRWLSDAGPDNSGIRHVLWALSGYMDMSTGRCFPTQEHLSRDTRMTLKTVRKYLKEAERLGWIRRERTQNRYGHWNYAYQATFPE